VNAIFARARRRAKQVGLEGVQPGAVTFVQRFGSSLNLNVHFHVVVADGVFEKTEDGVVVFHEGESPDRAELEAIVRTVRERIARWVKRRAAAHGSHDRDAGEEGALEACARLACLAGRLESTRRKTKL
jgi:hypothetical protein